MPNFLTQPAEWAPHRAVWTAWPSHPELWENNLDSAQKEFSELCRAIACNDSNGKFHGEFLEVLVARAEQLPMAQKALSGLPVRFHHIPFGDIWLRDTAPIFLKDVEKNKIMAAQFQFNGWGEKYSLPYDTEVSTNVARVSGFPSIIHSLVLEGGSVEVDGLGTALTTRQCLLNPNRNPDLTSEQIEKELKTALGLNKVIWISEGLINDHTDGHIDTIARFVGPGKVVCMQTKDEKDPNKVLLDKIATELQGQTDARGTPIEVIRIPAPGPIFDDEGELMPASYVNFYIGNASVVVPTYGSPNDSKAVDAISQLFPTRKTIGLSAYAILSGGGAFHCITQQEPT